MSEAPDPLEAELSALRPREVSPGLRRRVAERLADPPHARRRIWRIALAAGLAAACLAAVLFRRGGGPARYPIRSPSSSGPGRRRPPRSRRRTTRSPRSWRTSGPWPDRPKNWMPCSPSRRRSPRNPTRNSRESALSLGPMPHSAPY